MLKFSATHIAALDGHSERQYYEDLRLHLLRFSPRQMGLLTHQDLDQFISYGRARTHTYGFTYRGPIRLYFELMILLGSGFDTDPQYPSFAHLLHATDTCQMERARQLHHQVTQYLHHVSGPSRENAMAALERLTSLRLGQFDTWEGLEQTVIDALTNVYPEKAGWIGRSALEGLFAVSLEEADRLRLHTPQGVSLVAAIAYTAGHAVAKDPLYRWAVEPLFDRTDRTPEHSVQRLHRWLRALVRSVKSREHPTPIRDAVAAEGGL